MKKFISILSIVLGVSAVAATTDRITPNQFVCEGEGNTQLIYSVTSITGKPQFNVTFRGETVKAPLTTFQTTQTGMGTLVQLTDNHLVPLDGNTVRYNLVLPTVFLDSSATPEKFETMLVKTDVANPFFRPTPTAAVVENNEFVTVQCTAQRVFFAR